MTLRLISVTTMVSYTPLTKLAGLPSELRQIAYTGNTEVPGPDVDPTGWSVLPDVEVTGKLFDSRTVSAKYTVSRASRLA